MRSAFNFLLLEPLNHILTWLTSVLPGHDLGLAVIILTIMVRLVLFPLQHRMTHTQRKIKELEPTIKNIKVTHQNDQKAQAEAMMALYRAHGINPFSGFLLLLIQIPLLLALYWSFRSFVTAPGEVNHFFFNTIDLARSFWPFSLLAGLTQYFQVTLSLPPTPKPDPNTPPSFGNDLAKNMGRQMRFTLPIMIVLISLGLPSAVVLYWITSNLFGIGHELIVRRCSKALQVN